MSCGMSNVFNVVYSVIETFIVAQSTNIRSYTYRISRLGQYIWVIASWISASGPRAGAHGSHTEPSQLILIPHTNARDLYCCRVLRPFSLDTRFRRPSAPYPHYSTQRAVCTSSPTNPHAIIPRVPPAHPTARLLQATVGRRGCVSHASNSGDYVPPGRKLKGASPWCADMPERFGGRG